MTGEGEAGGREAKCDGAFKEVDTTGGGGQEMVELPTRFLPTSISKPLTGAWAMRITAWWPSMSRPFPAPFLKRAGVEGPFKAQPKAREDGSRRCKERTGGEGRGGGEGAEGKESELQGREKRVAGKRRERTGRGRGEVGEASQGGCLPYHSTRFETLGEVLQATGK